MWEWRPNASDELYKTKHQLLKRLGVENLAVIEIIAPGSFVLTPLIIFKGKNYLAGWHKEEEEEEDYWYGYVDKGYKNSKLCLEYIEKIFELETEA